MSFSSFERFYFKDKYFKKKKKNEKEKKKQTDNYNLLSFLRNKQ